VRIARSNQLVTLAFLANGCARMPPSKPVPEDIGACNSRIEPQDLNKHGESFIGARGAPNFSVCTATFLHIAYTADLSQLSYKDDKTDVVQWFCNTKDNTAAFSLLVAAQALIPDIPTPLGGNVGAGYSKQSRESACTYLENHIRSIDMRSLFSHVANNTAAIAGFNQCITTLTNAANGGGVTATIVGRAEVCRDDSFQVALQWQPASVGTSSTPIVSGISTSDGVNCCPLTVKSGQQLTAYNNYILLCRRTANSQSAILIHMHTYGDAVALLPAYAPLPQVQSDLTRPTVKEWDVHWDARTDISIAVGHEPTDCSVTRATGSWRPDPNPNYSTSCSNPAWLANIRRAADALYFDPDPGPGAKENNVGGCDFHVRCSLPSMPPVASESTCLK